MRIALIRELVVPSRLTCMAHLREGTPAIQCRAGEVELAECDDISPLDRADWSVRNIFMLDPATYALVTRVIVPSVTELMDNIAGVALLFITSARNDIGERVDRLLGQPYKSATDCLAMAQNAETKERAREHIDEARRLFQQAKNQDDPPLNVKAAFYVGVCFDILGEKRQAGSWYKNCYEMVFEVEDSLIRSIFRTKTTLEATADRIGRITHFIPGLSKMPGASVLVGDQEERFNKTLRQLRELYDCFDELSEVFVTRAGISKDEIRAVQAASKIVDRANYEERTLDLRKRETIQRGRMLGQQSVLQLFAE